MTAGILSRLNKTLPKPIRSNTPLKHANTFATRLTSDSNFVVEELPVAAGNFFKEAFSLKENTLITITRQYGSGGLAVAEAVAKKMGVKCYNRDIVIKAAKNIQNFEDIKDVIAEAYDTPNEFAAKLSFLAGQSVPRQNQMYNEQERVILDIAQEGSAVFVGRCADYILRNEPNCYSFFIYADDDYRREVVAKVYKDSSFEDVLDVDKQRKSYYAYFTGRTWGEPQNYDLMINTTKISVSTAAQIIL
ncbi:MAG: cytidylate kinase-like family protein, partial [Selenomonadaceae bacterium]|nr:cytidylate kinase-like family protein [Selenomonadaceae bacterium]